MKKFLLFLCLILVSATIVISENGFYSPNYINNLKDCSIFMSKSDIEIPQTDSNNRKYFRLEKWQMYN